MRGVPSQETSDLSKGDLGRHIFIVQSFRVYTMVRVTRLINQAAIWWIGPNTPDPRSWYSECRFGVQFCLVIPGSFVSTTGATGAGRSVPAFFGWFFCPCADLRSNHPQGAW